MKKTPKNFIKKKNIALKDDKILASRAEKLYFPKIYRFITEKLKRIFLLTGLIIIFLGVMSVLTFDNIKKYQQLVKINNEKQKIASEIRLWENIVKKYADFRDGYFRLALLEYKTGDKNKASFYLQKALAIDPNFKKGREFQKVLR